MIFMLNYCELFIKKKKHLKINLTFNNKILSDSCQAHSTEVIL